MINCIIIDDEPYARELLSGYIEKVPFLQLKSSFSSALKALEFLKKEAVDLIFLDIQMPELSGIDFLKIQSNRPKVVLTTAHAEFALDGYELDVLDYLLKPFSFARFLKAVEKASGSLDRSKIPPNTPSHTEYTFVKDGKNLTRVNFKDILYVKGLKDYIKIITTEGQIISLQSLKEFVVKSPNDTFIRVHNSYIVNINHVKVITKNRLEINGEMIPIGNTYKKQFLERINESGF